MATEFLKCTDDMKIARGDKGGQVKPLQTILKALGYYTSSGGRNLAIDGDFGYYTQVAVKSFQRAQGTLAVDGWVGKVTCGKLNEKIGAKEGTTPQATTSTGNDKKTTATVVKPDPYAPNLKNNVIAANVANLAIDGIRLVASSITRTNSFHGGNWKTIELMNGYNYVYKGRPVPLEYSIDTYISNVQYGKLSGEFMKMQERVCQVLTKLFPSGFYTLNVTVADEKVRDKKVTIKFVEYLVEK